MDAAAFNDMNRASEVLQKIGNGSADADFARAIGVALERSNQTGKKSKVVVTVELDPTSDIGSMILRCDVVAKLPKLPAPASHMHVDNKGGLLSQMEFLTSGGMDEAQRPRPLPSAASSSGSQRLIAMPPATAPLAAAPAPAPLKDDKSV